MKKLILLLLALLPYVSNAQSLFGYSPAEIKAKWPTEQFTYDKWGENKDLIMMSFIKDNMGIAYFFNKDNESVVTSVSPLTQGQLQTLVELYNKRYVIINTTTWRFYDSGSVYLCKLTQTDNGKYHFIWKIEE